jgi:hypothetical protein
MHTLCDHLSELPSFALLRAQKPRGQRNCEATEIPKFDEYKDFFRAINNYPAVSA